MKVLFPLQNLLRNIRARTTALSELEEPIRAELFSSERLEQHAESLAAAQRVTTTPRKGRRLLPRVLDNGRVLLASYRAIAKAIREERDITPAAEWLVDNFHIVDEQLREIQDDLPPGFYRELPQLAEGPLQGYPRVFGLAWAFVAHTDSRFDPESLRRFVRAYQRVQPLTIGELWAVAITLRVVLVENLRRLAERIVRGRAARQEADALADSLLGLGGRDAEPAVTALRRFEGTPLATAFAVQLVQRLRDQDPVGTPALRWIEERLTAQGTTVDEIVRVEHQRQAAMNVTVRNVITSMRLISAFDWEVFFESVSLVDAILWADTVCAAPDFVTRDHYRHAIEELARGSPHAELDVAQRAVLHTQHYQAEAPGASALPEDRRADPGYYLIAQGRVAFEQELGFRVPIKRWLRLAYLTQAALDYTATRLPQDTRVAVVRAYMAHHQGMSLVALANVLHDGVMRARFHAEPRMQATELLLQERTPRNVLVTRPRVEEVQAVANVRDLVPPALRRFTSPHDPTPSTHLLSNGRYVVMVTAAGSGYSRWRDLAVTRWREDSTRDAWGTYVFLRDGHSGAVWSAAYQPSGVEPDTYEVVFSEDHVEIRRRDGTIATTLEVVVSPEHDAEVRRVSITNLGTQTREIELTSYAEIVLAPPAADAAHPAFSNLFVQTEWAPELGALLATRRPRSHGEPQVWTAHVVVAEGDTVGDMQYETDRARFLGRGRGIRTPLSVIDGHPLSNTVGAVLDPIFSLRRRVRLAPGATARVTFSTLVASSRDEALALADEYRDPATFERAVALAWTQAQVQLRHLGMDHDEASPLPGSRQPDPLLGPDAAAVVRRAHPQYPGALGALGTRHFRRCPDRPRADRCR